MAARFTGPFPASRFSLRKTLPLTAYLGVGELEEKSAFDYAGLYTTCRVFSSKNLTL